MYKNTYLQFLDMLKKKLTCQINVNKTFVVQKKNKYYYLMFITHQNPHLTNKLNNKKNE